MASDTIKLCSRRLAGKNLTIAFAESATAGWMASEFSLTPNSGDVLLGGIVCYNADVKQKLFGISKKTIDTYTPESAEVTRLIAEGLSKYFDCDIAVGITGLTTAGGSETPDKPVGTMFIHITLPNNKYHYHREVFTGTAEDIIAKAIERTGELLTTIVENLEVARQHN